MTKYNPLTGHNYPTDGAYLRAKINEARDKRLFKQRLTNAAYAIGFAWFALCVYLVLN